jgi:hypothetical protein
MKKILLSSFLAFGIYTQAQIDVNASAGTATATYTTLKDAFDAINSGTHQGVINLSITANTTETATAVLNAATTYTSLTIKPTVTATVSGAIASNPLVKILGSNVTIDGATTTGGTTKNLTFTNTSATSPSVLFMGSPTAGTPLTNVTIKNSIFVNGSSNTTNFVIANGSTAAGYFNNVTVQNNDVKTGFNGIFVLATATATNGNNLVITGNTVDGSVQNGILLSGVGGTSTVSNNTVNNVNPNIGASASAPAASFAINISTGTNNTSVFGNKITVKSTPASGVNYINGISITPGTTNVSSKIYNNIISEISGFLSYVNSAGIYVGGVTPNVNIYSNKISGLKNTNTQAIQGITLGSTSTAANTLLYNNVISDVLATTTGNAFGIYMFSGAGYKLYNNTINLNTTNGETGLSAALIVNSAITTANSVDIRNNIFSNTKASGGTVGIYSTAANTVFSNIDYNNYSAGTALGYIGGAIKNTIADIQTGFGGNTHSLAISPAFESATDFHLKNDVANKDLDNKGLSLPEVITDFDGVTRSSTPDMGAYEFTYTTLAVSDVNKANISVYPNPFTDVLKISDVKGVRSVSVNDMSGRQVKSLAPSAEINLSSLNAGLYIVNLQMEDGSVKTFKAIKK